jgi:hypothetical protein
MRRHDNKTVKDELGTGREACAEQATTCRDLCWINHNCKASCTDKPSPHEVDAGIFRKAACRRPPGRPQGETHRAGGWPTEHGVRVTISVVGLASSDLPALIAVPLPKEDARSSLVQAFISRVCGYLPLVLFG